jgi:hypothetical protein
MIKGLAARLRPISALLFLEKLIGGAAVARGFDHVGLNPLDLGLQDLDPLLELLDRQGPKVLLRDLRQWVLRPVREEIVLVHGEAQR